MLLTKLGFWLLLNTTIFVLTKRLSSMSPAAVYGKYGLYGDGPGVLMYAIGHNLAYIGTEEFADITTSDEMNHTT